MIKSLPAFVFGLASVTLMAQSPRTVLLETSESVWLSATSSGICAKELCKATHGTKLATISYHWDNIFGGGDPFYKSFADQWSQTFNATSSIGGGAIDRVAYNGTSLFSVGRSNWTDTIAARLNKPSDALVTLPEVLIDGSDIYIRAQIKFSQGSIVNREMRFFCYVVQDAVQGPQVVDTTNLGTCTLFNTGLVNDTAYGYYHNDVAILNPSTYQGTDNKIPNQVAEGSHYSAVYTFTKPTGVNIADLRIVAFVANYSAADMKRNEVINAAEKFTFTTYDKNNTSDPNHPDNPDNPNSLLHPNNWPLGNHRDVIQPQASVAVSPNPVTELGMIHFSVPSTQHCSVEVTDMQGRPVRHIYSQKLAAGAQHAAFTTSGLATGSYMVRIQGENFVLHTRVVVMAD